MNELTIGQRIAHCRKKLGISQEALGEKLGVSRQSISKWEADGAMPEIDKFIAMSKLFNVSVGWLLGVEEQQTPAPAQETPAISEELLRQIEKIVLRYQPKKQPMSMPKKVAVVVAVLLAIWAGGTFISHWQNLSSTVAYVSGQVRTNNEQNANILGKLADLESQIDAPPKPDPLLGSYDFTLNPYKGGAEVVFSAVPVSWQEGDTASLTIRNGEASQQLACTWDGAYLSAVVNLETKNGYTLCFTQNHADGTSQLETLSDYYVENLSRALTLDSRVIQGKWGFDREDMTLSLKDYEAYMCKPLWAEDGDHWESAKYLLYHVRGTNRQVVDTYDLLGERKEHLEDSGAAGDNAEVEALEFWFYTDPVFELPDLQEGDGLELWFSASYSNGIADMRLVQSWAYMQDGRLNTSVPVE